MNSEGLWISEKEGKSSGSVSAEYSFCESLKPNQIRFQVSRGTLSNMATLSSNHEENLKESQHTTDVKEEPRDLTAETADTLLPRDVLCDSCIDSPSKAIKSCLTCLVSYCEAHLRPHLENAKFQNHRLVGPLHDIDCRTCEVHQLPLERFCLVDGCCVCLDCENQEHKGHTTASVGEARAQIEVLTQHNT